MVSGNVLPTGIVLNSRFTITQTLKAGGMSQIYLAQDQNLADRVCAVKEFNPKDADQDGIDGFRREVAVLASLDHPNIVKVWDSFQARGNWYIVMEYVEGRTLEEALQNSPQQRLEENQVVEWAVQLCHLLEYLHSRTPPIIFRDLKPENVMVNIQGTLKLIDFGIVHFFNPTRSTGTARFGTDGYAPEEQYNTTRLTGPYSDIYALGATMHHLLTGRDPKAEDLFSFPPVRSLNSNVAVKTEEIVTKALKSSVAERYQTAELMRRDLETGSQTACPQCGHSNAATEVYCQRCAGQLRQQLQKCTSCGADIPAAPFCRACGAKQP